MDRRLTHILLVRRRDSGNHSTRPTKALKTANHTNDEVVVDVEVNIELEPGEDQR